MALGFIRGPTVLFKPATLLVSSTISHLPLTDANREGDGVVDSIKILEACYFIVSGKWFEIPQEFRDKASG
jgi:hypothetical protein